MSQEKKLNSILENMKLAKAALIACIILALLVLAPMKLSSKREKAQLPPAENGTICPAGISLSAEF